MSNHRLKVELYDLLSRDLEIFKFLEGASLDGVWYWDLENPEEEWMSDRFWEVLGYDPSTKKPLVSEWQDIIHPDDLQVAVKNFELHCADPNHPYDQVVRYTHKNGSTVWVRCREMAIRNAAGKPIRMLGAHNDITELKQAELDTAQMLKNRERFFARMSHEIRTPLHGMIGIAELLKAKVVDEDIQQELGTILRCGTQLQHLLNDLLTLSKIDEEKFSVSIEDVSLRTVIDYVTSLYRSRVKAKGLTLSINNKDFDGFIVQSDQVRLTQVISNLVSNAVKFTYHGTISVTVSATDEHYTLCIVDTGEGIKDIEAALNPYHQEHEGQELALQGTGLGLEIVEKLCDAMSHTLTIESEVGKGTRVCITMPKSLSESLPIESTIEHVVTVSNAEKPAKVLIVDDNGINRDIAQYMLEGTIDEIGLASNGKEAVELYARSGGYDVVLMDLNMPVKNGFDAALEIRAMKNVTTTPRIIALSADAFEETRQRCARAGMVQHVAKPFTQELLLEAVLNPANHRILPVN